MTLKSLLLSTKLVHMKGKIQNMKNIKDYNIDALKEEMKQLDEKPFRAEQIFKWLYQDKVTSFDKMLNLSL